MTALYYKCNETISVQLQARLSCRWAVQYCTNVGSGQSLLGPCLRPPFRSVTATVCHTPYFRLRLVSAESCHFCDIINSDTIGGVTNMLCFSFHYTPRFLPKKKAQNMVTHGTLVAVCMFNFVVIEREMPLRTQHNLLRPPQSRTISPKKLLQLHQYGALHY